MQHLIPSSYLAHVKPHLLAYTFPPKKKKLMELRPSSASKRISEKRVVLEKRMRI
jgi:hypothetical protein